MATTPDDNSLASLNWSIRAEIAYLDSPTDYREFIRPAETAPLVMLAEGVPPRRQRLTSKDLLWRVLTPIVIYVIIRLVVTLLTI